MQRLTGIVLILLVCLQAQGQNSTCSRRFIVAVNNYAPHFYRDSRNRPKGLTHDLIDTLQRRVGCVFIEKDQARAVTNDSLKTNRVDIAALFAKNPEFDKLAFFEPIYRSKRELIMRRSLYVPEKSLQDYILDKKIIYGNIIGSHTGLSPKEEAELRKSHRLIEAVDVATLYSMLKKNRVHALIMLPFTNSYYEKLLEMKSDVVRVVDEDHPIEVGIYYSKRRISMAEKQKMEEAIEAMRKDGTLSRLISEYPPGFKDSKMVVSIRR
jgi:polar amino acid transport system substrate-binding protein